MVNNLDTPFVQLRSCSCTMHAYLCCLLGGAGEALLPTGAPVALALAGRAPPHEACGVQRGSHARCLALPITHPQHGLPQLPVPLSQAGRLGGARWVCCGACCRHRDFL